MSPVCVEQPSCQFKHIYENDRFRTLSLCNIAALGFPACCSHCPCSCDWMTWGTPNSFFSWAGAGGGCGWIEGNVSFVPQLLNWYTGSHWIRNLNFSVFLYLYLQEEKIHLCHLLYKIWQKKWNFNIGTLIFSPRGKIHPCQQFFVTFSNI